MSKRKNDSVKKVIFLIWLAVFAPLIGILCLIGLILLGVFGELPKVEDLQNPKNNLASVVYADNMEILGKYYTENRINVRYPQLDKDLVNALIATEDVRFYEHTGVDFKAIGRSFFGVLTGSSRGGGSTLTQQLAKMMFPREKLSKPELVIRKLKEWIIAVRLEKLYTKEEILSMYLNKFDFLNLAVGIHSAARIYFNTTPDSLQLHQAALLVGMAKNPSLFNPIRFPQRAKERRNVVLGQMKKYGFIDEATYQTYKNKDLDVHFTPEDHNEGLAPYFREYLRDNFLREWCSNHINPETGKPYNIYKDGLRIYTTIHPVMQRYAEEAVEQHMKELQKEFFKECKTKRNAPFAWNVSKEEIKKIMIASMKRTQRYQKLKEQGLSDAEIEKNFHTPVPMSVFTWGGDKDTVMTPWDSIRYYKSFLQCGFLAIEPSTGYVKAWVGGINHRHFQYDHVKVSKRQVGSTFKPFVYAMAIQEGLSPCYQVPNVRTCITLPEGKEWCPDNSDGNKGTGQMITLKRALALSINYVTAWVMKQYGPDPVVDFAKQLGITSDIPRVPSICLGTADISLFEMVGAMASFPNYGTYIQPTFITRIEDKNGNLLDEFIPQSREVMSEDKAYVMIQLLRGVCDYGTGARLRGTKFKLTQQIGGKTGTTQNNSDGWFVGFVSDLAAGAWVGGEDRSIHFNSMAMGQGASMALPIWGYFMKKVLSDPSLKIEAKEFRRPEGLDPNLELDCSKKDAEYKDNPEEINESGF